MESYLKSAAIGGLLGGVVAALAKLADVTRSESADFALLLALLACGLLAVRHQRVNLGRRLTGRQAVGIGALAGIVGGLLATGAVSFMMLTGIDPGHARLMKFLDLASSLGGSAAEMVRTVVTYLHIISAVKLATMGTVLGSVGGAFGWTLTQPGKNEAAKDA